MSAARFRLTAQEGCPVPLAAPVPVTAHGGCPPPPPYHCSGRDRGSRRPLHFSPPTVRSRSSLLCSVLATASPLSPIIDEPTEAVLPSRTRSLSAAPRDFPCRRLPSRAPHWWQPSLVVPPPLSSL
jgi:hypothetical protein